MDWRGAEGQLSVHKFGGTSMANGMAMRNSAQIVAEIQGQRLIVVSAAAGVTRALMHLSHPNTPVDEQKRLLLWMRTTHEDMLTALKDPGAIQAQVAEFLQQMVDLHKALHGAKERNPKDVDAMLSLGEKLSSIIFTQVLVEQGRDAVWFAAGKTMKTSNDFGTAEPLLPELKREAQKQLTPLLVNKIVVTQGFIGATLKGETTTLGKEASDYSAALFAEALGAHHFAIWSDLPGIFTADPKIANGAQPIHFMSIDNALALTEAGAKVLHPRTMLPALRANMPFFVGSSQGLTGGTWVLPKALHQEARITALNLRPEQMILTFQHDLALGAEAPLPRILKYFDTAHIKPAYLYKDHLTTHVLLDDSLKDFRCESVLTETHRLELNSIAPLKIEWSLQMIAVIGSELESHGELRKTLSLFMDKYNVRVLSFGMSPHALFILVREEPEIARIMLRELHEKLFGS